MAKYNAKQATFFEDFAAGVFSPAASGSVPETKETSLAAAESIKPRCGTDRARVLDCIRAAGELGVTDEEIQTLLSMNPSTQRPRRIELLNARLIQPSGRRKTRSGREAVTWICTERS